MKQNREDLIATADQIVATRDAHGLYAQFGFGPVVAERLMERVNPDIYLNVTR